MSGPVSSFDRPSWRDALRPARPPSLQGWLLCGPGGFVAARLDAALTPLRRMRGLLGRAALAPDEALIIRPCSQVHGIGMRHAFDAVFCDDELRVLHISTVQPRSLSRYVRGADCCIELAAGRADACGLALGAQLTLRPAP
jgi:uncharacterized membrane protein (UPF0127 family)